MSEGDKNLQETVAAVIEETQDTSKADVTTETNEELSKDNSDETKSGETAEYASGIDISDIPEQDRPRIKKALEEKAGLLEKGYQGKFKEVSELKKSQEDLQRMGLTVNEARDVLTKHIQAKQNPVKATADKKQAVKILDKLLEQTQDYDSEGKFTGAKTQLAQFRDIILEETDVKSLREEVANLKTLLTEVSGETTNTRRSKVEQSIDSWKGKYGEELIEKYRNNFIDAHLNPKYKIPINKLLQSVIPLEELEQAILSQSQKKTGKPLTEEKKKAISSSGSGITSATEKTDVKGMSLKDLVGKTLLKK